jgi:CBS domain-containing protein
MESISSLEGGSFVSLEHFCRKPLVKVSPDTNITRACRLMKQNNIGCLVAEEAGELCGIITDRDIALRVAGAEKNPRETLVKQIMTPDPHHSRQRSATTNLVDAPPSRAASTDRQRLQ